MTHASPSRDSLENVRLYVHDPADDPLFHDELRENSCKLCCKVATSLSIAGLCIGILFLVGYSVYRVSV